MTIAAVAIENGRTLAESLMTLTLTAYSPNGTTTDPDGYEVPAFENEGTTPGKVQAGTQAGSDATTRYVNIGGVERPVLSEAVHVPISAFLDPGDDSLLIVASEQRGQGWELEVTAVGAADDPSLIGRRYLVVSAPAKSKATARRLDVVQL